MLNKVILMGRLTRDPELRHTQSDVPVASFTLAVDRGYSRRDDPQQQTADFVNIVAWRNTAEFVSKWFSKGQLVAVILNINIGHVNKVRKPFHRQIHDWCLLSQNCLRKRSSFS